MALHHMDGVVLQAVWASSAMLKRFTNFIFSSKMKWHPTPVACLRIPGQGVWVGCHPWGFTESWHEWCFYLASSSSKAELSGWGTVVWACLAIQDAGSPLTLEKWHSTPKCSCLGGQSSLAGHSQGHVSWTGPQQQHLYTRGNRIISSLISHAFLTLVPSPQSFSHLSPLKEWNSSAFDTPASLTEDP